MIKKFNEYIKEGLTDQMKPKSEEDIIKSLSFEDNDDVYKFLSKYKNELSTDFVIKLFNKKKYETSEDVRSFVIDVYKIVYWNNQFFTSLTKSEFIEDKYILKRLSQGFSKEGPGDVAKDIKEYLINKGHKIN